MKYKVLAFDLGGKSIKYTIFVNKKWLFVPRSVKINNATGNEVLAIMKQIYNEQKSNINSIAVSAPGAIDKNGTICGPSAIREFYGFNLKDKLAKIFQFKGPIIVINDGNAAAYANYSTVNRQSTIVTIAIGTGIGGGIVINGKLVLGKNGFGGEMGLMILSSPFLNKTKDIKTCSQLSGFYSLETYYKKQSGVLKEGKEIFKLYDQSDKNAIKAVSRMYSGLATIIINIIVLLDPDHIFISGALANRLKASSEITSYVNNLQKKLGLNLKTNLIKNSPLKSHSQLWGIYDFFIDSMNE